MNTTDLQTRVENGCLIRLMFGKSNVITHISNNSATQSAVHALSQLCKEMFVAATGIFLCYMRNAIFILSSAFRNSLVFHDPISARLVSLKLAIVFKSTADRQYAQWRLAP